MYVIKRGINKAAFSSEAGLWNGESVWTVLYF